MFMKNRIEILVCFFVLFNCAFSLVLSLSLQDNNIELYSLCVVCVCVIEPVVYYSGSSK